MGLVCGHRLPVRAEVVGALVVVAGVVVVVAGVVATSQVYSFLDPSNFPEKRTFLVHPASQGETGVCVCVCVYVWMGE